MISSGSRTFNVLSFNIVFPSKSKQMYKTASQTYRETNKHSKTNQTKPNLGQITATFMPVVPTASPTAQMENAQCQVRGYADFARVALGGRPRDCVRVVFESRPWNDTMASGIFINNTGTGREDRACARCESHGTLRHSADSTGEVIHSIITTPQQTNTQYQTHEIQSH
jgi:hypothetical protein